MTKSGIISNLQKCTVYLYFSICPGLAFLNTPDTYYNSECLYKLKKKKKFAPYRKTFKLVFCSNAKYVLIVYKAIKLVYNE